MTQEPTEQELRALMYHEFVTHQNRAEVLPDAPAVYQAIDAILAKSRLSAQGQATREQIARTVYEVTPFDPGDGPVTWDAMKLGESPLAKIEVSQTYAVADAILALSPEEPRQTDAAAIRRAALEEAEFVVQRRLKNEPCTKAVVKMLEGLIRDIRSLITADKQESV